MSNKISAGVGRMALVFALTGFVMGLMGGLTMFVGMGIMNSKADGAMGAMMRFLGHPDNVDSFGGMAVGIASYTARANEISEPEYQRMFPGTEAEALKQLEGFVGAWMDDMMGTMRLMALVGMPFMFAMFGAMLGALGMLIKNWLSRIKPEA